MASVSHNLSKAYFSNDFSLEIRWKFQSSCSYTQCNKVIATKFLSCHGNHAVVAQTKICCDLMSQAAWKHSSKISFLSNLHWVQKIPSKLTLRSPFLTGLRKTRQIWRIWKLWLAYSLETPNLGQNWPFSVPCDLKIWWMNLNNNRASLLDYFKLCASFRSQMWIQTRVTVRQCSI